MKKSVIIGAGQTGRGFIAPIMEDNGYQITFIDKDKTLIDQMTKENQYEIHYFGNVREKRVINKFYALHIDDKRVPEEIASADIILISVFSSHIKDLVSYLKHSEELKKDQKMTIVCCENGINVKQPLIDANIDAIISEGIIFCTTLKPKDGCLNLISEDYPDIPVDGEVEGFNITLKRMPSEKDFDSLIQRKIYTYNFISAVIAYLGSYKGIESYGEAANDPDIAYVISQVVPVISRIIAKEYNIEYDVQLQFTNRAVIKFQNKDIYDTIYRNARQAVRKLGRNERILTPLWLACKYNDDMREIEIIAASALYYGYEKENLNIGTTLSNIKEILGDDYSLNRIMNLITLFEKKEKLCEIIKVAERS